MKILGIHVGHDSSAALVVDGRIMADVAEERFTRIKHYCGLPIQSVEYCLRSCNLTINDIDMVAVPGSCGIVELNFLLDLKGSRREQRSFAGRLEDTARRRTGRALKQPPLYIKNFPLKNSTPIVHVEHHLAHAASAYYTSRAPGRQLIVTMDGAGDGVSVCLWRGENGKIEPLEKFGTEASLGWFYSNVTEALGWWHGDGEGKTMGLAPYGDSDKARGVLEKFHPKFASGKLVEPHDFGQTYLWNETGGLQWHFEEAREIQALLGKHGREHIAAEAQRVLEEQTAAIVYPWMEREGTRNLTCSGGVFLNVKLNQRIWESGRVEHQHIYANAGDSGLAVGAALFAYHEANPGAAFDPIEHLYWGPEYSEQEIEEILKLRRLSYRRVDNVAEYCAQQLANDKIVGWFQGRMESGPRALGNRSILMSANRAENKDIINARVKFREAFRPFCPSLLWEKRSDYIEKARRAFFILNTPSTKRSWRDWSWLLKHCVPKLPWQSTELQAWLAWQTCKCLTPAW